MEDGESARVCRVSANREPHVETEGEKSPCGRFSVESVVNIQGLCGFSFKLCGTEFRPWAQRMWQKYLYMSRLVVSLVNKTNESKILKTFKKDLCPLLGVHLTTKVPMFGAVAHYHTCGRDGNRRRTTRTEPSQSHRCPYELHHSQHVHLWDQSTTE